MHRAEAHPRQQRPGGVGHRARLHDHDRRLGGNTEQLTYHLGPAEQNGVTEAELIEAITDRAFYAA
jgi:hypothetical protein